MPERCPVAHRIDELEFAGCAACAWREYHVVNDARMDLGVQISAANLEVSRLTARLTVLAGVLREVHEIASNWDEEGRQRCQRIIEIVAGALGAERA